MKNNNNYLADNEIDLGDLIKSLVREKILILSISLIFMVAGYVYGALQPKIYKKEIVLSEAPSSLFEVYKPFFNTQQQQQQQQQQRYYYQTDNATRHFNNEFKLILSSLDTLVQFVEKTNTFDDFKNYLKEKNISVIKYFEPQLGTRKFKAVIDKQNNILNKYSLTYSQPLRGEAFLNDYIIFAHQKTLTVFKQQLTQTITSSIITHQQHLEIAKKIELENPILQSMLVGKTVVNEPDELFYKGTKVLTQQINYLNKLLNEVKNLTLDYNPILEQASSEMLISKSPIIYASIASLLGLFFSLIIVFIRSRMHK